MRVSSAAIFTLATLAASNVTQQAKAEPAKAATQAETASDVVVSVIENTQRLGTGELKPQSPHLLGRAGAVAAPETVVTPKFSQNPIIAPIGRNNSFSLALKPVEQKNTSSVTIIVPTAQRPNSPTPSTLVNDLVLTAINVQIVGANPELQQIIRKVIKTQTGGETSQTQLQKDVVAILNTGLFSSALVNTSIQPGGLNVVYQVQPVVVQAIQLSGAQVLTYKVAQERLKSQIGNTISPIGLQQAVQQINQWYLDRGYNLARVLSIKPSPQGILTVNVAEGLVGDIKFRFVNDQGETIDSQGNPVKGRTKVEFLRQQLKLRPGQVFQENIVKQDVGRLSQTGLFETVNVAFEGDAKKLDLVYEVKEIGARGINLGGNYNADQGIEVTLSYKDQNVGGVNDTIVANVGVSREDVQFNSKFSSPYRETNPNRLGYSVNAFRRRDLSDTFDDKIKLSNGDKVREAKFGGGISLQKPIEDWDTSLGINYSRISIRDRQGNITPTDAKGNPLSFSGTGVDDLTTVSFTATQDRRNNLNSPTAGSLLTLSTEQSIPIGQGSISMNRLRANYSQYLPVKLFNSKQPQVFALNLQAGTVIGDLPPYETFNLGGSNSVRGYDSGNVGSGRSYVLASAEYRFPIISIAGGVLFADYASDLGSGDTVLGDPAGVRGKPGYGFGYGAGLRVESPLGLIRADYGINNQGEGRVHIGIGQRF
jgi:outer membrane protein insertion porin family